MVPPKPIGIDEILLTGPAIAPIHREARYEAATSGMRRAWREGMNTDRSSAGSVLAPLVLLSLVACSSAGGDEVSSKSPKSGSGGGNSSLGIDNGNNSSTTGGQTTGGDSTSNNGSGGSPSNGTGTPGTGGSPMASNTGSGGSNGAAGGAVVGMNTCVMAALAVANPIISNFDDAADMGLDVMAVSPGGKWTLDKDGSSGTAALAVEDSGSAEQKKAAHFHGAGLTTWGADMAATLSGPTTPVDGSTYSGISFKVKAGANNKATAITVKMQNADSLPACGMCDPADMMSKACYSGYAASANISGTGWSPVQIPWASMKAPAWGLHTSTAVDPKQLFVISIVVDKGADFDLWIDDVAFYK
jgi:hypothetical protein